MIKRLPYGNGRRITWLRRVTDLPSRRRLEEELGIFEAIVASSDDAIVSKTLEGVITSWNQAAERLFGYTAQEAIGQSITLIIPPELHSEEDEILRKLRQGIRIQHFETVRVRKDGTRVEVSLSISPVKNRAGKIIGAAKIARDISERKRSEAQFSIILQGVADGILLYGQDNRIMYANEAAARMMGFSSLEEMLSTQGAAILSKYEIVDEHGEPFPHPQLTHLRVFAGEPAAQAIIGYREVGSDQPDRWSLVTSRPVPSVDQKATMVVTIIHDVTELMRIEHRKDEFISMASHELKTPVTSLKGFTHVLQRRLAKEEDPQGLYYLTRIDAQIDKLTALISELLDISRMQSGKLAFHMEPVDLDTLIDETVEMVQAATSTHRLFVEGRTEAQVMGDQKRLEQVFINLLTNAIKYSPGTENVLVRLWRDGDDGQAIVSVQDFGIGIDKAHHEQIFERFYQVSDPTEKTYPGLGIGLYICREIVARHQGRMWVESSKGQGSTFFVALPRLGADESTH